MAAASLLLTVAACASPAGVTAEDAWSRPAPPVAPARAVYLELANGTQDSITVTGAESDACDSVEIHETSMDDAGVMRMRPLFGGLSLAAGESVVLAPGGIHLMCMEPITDIASFGVTLRIRGAEDIVTTVAIEGR